MSREIKFRAWDEGNKKMFTDVQFITSGDENNDWILFTSNEQRYKVDGMTIVFDNPYFRQQIKLMQYTGLKDKNDKEIYEGDLVIKHVKDYGRSLKGPFLVNWVRHRAGFNITDSGKQEKTHWYEVVGNIYEQPELIKQCKTP